MASFICAICFEELLPESICYALECGHVYHKPCISTWGNTGNGTFSCPTCRKLCKSKLRLFFQINESGDTRIQQLQEIGDHYKNLYSKAQKDLFVARQARYRTEQERLVLAHENTILEQNYYKLAHESQTLKRKLKGIETQQADERKELSDLQSMFYTLKNNTSNQGNIILNINNHEHVQVCIKTLKRDLNDSQSARSLLSAELSKSNMRYSRVLSELKESKNQDARNKMIIESLKESIALAEEFGRGIPISDEEANASSPDEAEDTASHVLADSSRVPLANGSHVSLDNLNNIPKNPTRNRQDLLEKRQGLQPCRLVIPKRRK